MRRLVLFIATLLIATSSSILAAELPESAWDSGKLDELATFLRALHEHKQFNGTILLAQDGKVVFEESLGYANIDKNEPLGPRSSFRLASLSKQFTAMGIMMLKEQGKLDYEDDIRKYLPELPYEGITIRHLLNHTSGLPDYIALFDRIWDPGTSPDRRRMAFNRDVVEQFAKHKPPLRFRPGERFEYSNTGYVLLGEVIERVSGQPVQSFLQSRIFDVVGMKDSAAFSPGESFKLKHRVSGFAWTDDGLGHRQNDYHDLNGVVGDGGIYASARDLLKWDQALYTERLVSQSTLKEAFTPGKLADGTETGYGFGWEIRRNSNGSLQVRHSGGWVGFRTHIARDIEEKDTLIVLTSDTSSNLRCILLNIPRIREGKDYRLPWFTVDGLKPLLGKFWNTE